MEDLNNENPIKSIKKCKHIECDELNAPYLGFCEYHVKGGVFASGETYEQYQIIEQDFIDFIKIVPLNCEINHSVYSPVLRDIIIRCCVQIELFFKEWLKYHCTEVGFEEQLKIYNIVDKTTGEPKGARNWKFKDYFLIKKNFLGLRPLHVRDLNINLKPFDSWKSIGEVPNWWSTYNAIKHDGLNSKNEVNLIVTLNALGALFTLHCCNNYTREYLKQYSSIRASSKWGKIKLKFDQITTPLDSKKYLFKDIYSSSGEGIEIQKASNTR